MTTYNSIFEEINNLFAPARSIPQYVESSDRSSIYNTEDSVVVEVDLPGYGRDNIEIDIDGDALVVEAKREVDAEKKYYRKNISRKKYSESFKLGSGLDVDNISASYTDGVLVVTVPKTEEKKAKKIDIE